MTKTKATTARWALRNKNTGNFRSFKATREAARISKRPNEIIFDTIKGVAVR
jgi:hypothetical protein